MKICTYTLRFLLTTFCFALSAIVYATGMEPFEIRTSVYEITVSEERYIIDFNLPDYEIEDIDVIEGGYPDVFSQYGSFHSINIVGTEEYDKTDEIGYPELPFFSIELLLPSNLTNMHTHLEYYDMTETDVSHYIAPAIKGNMLQTTENEEYTIVERDEDYCAIVYPAIECTDNIYSLSEPYNIFSSTGVTLSVHPFIYEPNSNRLQIVERGRIIIEFDGEPLSSAINRIRDTQTFKSAFAMEFFKEFPWVDFPGERYHPSFLIVAATSDIQQSIQPFVEYKSDCGYNVKTICLEDYGALGQPNNIYSLIQGKNPDYVLLVGNLEQIPAFAGSSRFYHPYSDDGYHSLTGRWIVTDSRQVETVIDKTIAAEQNLSFSGSAIALLSGTGNGECAFYRTIETIVNDAISGIGIDYTIYDGRNGADFSSFQEATLHSSIVLYRGHGGIITCGNDICGSFIPSPYMITSYPLQNYMALDALGNDSPAFPIGLGIACSLNTYATDNNIGSRWVNSTCGGVAFYAATTESARANNNNLTKRMFNVLKEKSAITKGITLSNWLHTAEIKYYQAFSTLSRCAEIAKYNLIGDPTFKVYGRSTAGYSPRRPNCQSEKSDTQSIVRFEVLSINGQIIMQGGEDSLLGKNDICQGLPNGVYLIKYYFANGCITTDKLFITK